MPNRLATQTSPYLLQHAHNPVDWYPWGAEAFAAARLRNLPIFLSVGYSTCYWCHVMERESFENPALAARLNASFISIKIDREERPDVDEIYMLATQLMSGHGGWPMNVFLDPASLRPFWCGTYFPPEPRGSMPGFAQVLEVISDAWRHRQKDVLEQAEQLADAVRDQLAAARTPVPVGQPQVRHAIEQLMRLFDRTHGGFGGAPKFPQPVFMDFLLRARAHIEDPQTRAALDHAICHTLDRISIGGIHDHVGGGFHRYAVDATWTVPHFEKMLYDNAQLALVFARAARIYDDAWYRRIVRRTLDYVLREMTEPAAPGAAGFFSAQDAEVDHREGLNYLWTGEQFSQLLADDADFAREIYGLSAGPNFQDPHHPDEPARSVLRLKDRPDRLAQARQLPADELFARLDRVNERLLAARSQRKPPLTDDKVITSWNGLMIAALTEGAELLADDRYARAARAAARFIVEHMYDADGRLLRIGRNRQAHTPAFLEDHGALISALCALHRTGQREPGFDPLEAAVALAARARDAFADASGAYFDTREDQSDLFVRPRSTYDGAMPSGPALMLHALIDLAELTDDRGHADAAGRLLASVSADLARSPVACVHATHAILRLIASPLPSLADQIDDDAAADDDAAPSPDSPVQIFADAEQLTISPEQPGVVRVEMRIRPGYHIAAADAGPAGDGLLPLRVGLVRGQGVAVYADYPQGEPFGSDSGVRVYTGIIAFDVVIEHAPGVGAGPGEPVLGVTFQACTDTECLEPRTLALDILLHLEEH
ncbi:MAG: thioredoxin domain-containing protein [Leptolyngbya sp. PLA3]|nr:MAG: thioredoxin domain-containing protein [Cyanobacteria bacterium CYA]MCE7967332.1 thioredoxin domain-containing protein [Leptolyngbya sp. PL-A3]